MSFTDFSEPHDLADVKNAISRLREEESRLLTESINELKNTSDINKYLDILNGLKDDFLIVLCTKDTPGDSLPAATVEKIHDLGFTSFTKENRRMYAGVSYKGNILCNKQGKRRGDAVIYSNRIDIPGVDLSVLSMSWNKGNRAAAIINGQNYSTNTRGLNFVVYDINKKQLVDSFGYDQYAVQPNISRTVQVSDDGTDQLILNIILNYQDRLEAMSNQIKTARAKEDIFRWNMYRNENESISDCKKRFFKSLRCEDEDLSAIQKANVILLEEFGRICQKNCIDYWLDFGTLIGAVRHNGFIPWDDDIDVGMVRKDIPKIQKAIENSKTFIELDQYWASDAYQIVKVYRIKFKDMDMENFVDIFPYDYCNPDDMSERWNRYRQDRGEFIKIKSIASNPGRVINETEIAALDEKLEEYNSTSGFEQSSGKYLIWGIENYTYLNNRSGITATDMIFPLNRKMEFDGELYTVPQKSEEHLAEFYGDIYTLPDDILGHNHLSVTEDAVMKSRKAIELYGK